MDEEISHDLTEATDGIAPSHEEDDFDISAQEIDTLVRSIFRPNKPKMTGAEFIEYMTKNDLFIPRGDRPDSPEFARQLRAEAERRGR